MKNVFMTVERDRFNNPIQTWLMMELPGITAQPLIVLTEKQVKELVANGFAKPE